MNTVQEFYNAAVRESPSDLTNLVGFNRKQGSDLSAHLPLLKYFASVCDHVTEFGLREGSSTSAFAVGLNSKDKTLVSYDIVEQPGYHTLSKLEFPCAWKFYLDDIVKPGWEIDETDFLFVDDLHTYDQVKLELNQHAHKAMKYLGFHDTYSQGEKSLDKPGEEGILRAIQEYTSGGWELIYSVDFNHGLQIYKRK